MTTPGEHKGGQPTSLSLLQRVRGKDEAAWFRLHELYRPFVLYWCGRWGVRAEDREDVAQDVFRVAVARLEDFRRDRPGDSFRAWLRGIAHNVALQHFRRAGQQVAGAGGSDVLGQLRQVPAPAEEEDPPEQTSELYRRALELVRGEFEERSWRMFWMTVIDGRPPADVAGEMGVSAAAVRQAKSRVLRRLREEAGELLDI